MKRNKIMFVIAIVAILAVLFVACDEGTQPEHTHTYGAWTITTAPTEDTAGSATRACACGDVQTTTVAKLSDASVWTVSVSQDATHETAGFKAYKSADFGTITVTVPKGEHAYGAWEISKEPTETETGIARRFCACGHYEEVALAVLTNTTVWTKTTEGATHQTPGKEIYTSEYGVVTIVTDAIQHVYGEWTSNGNGTHSRVCSCGDKQTENCVYNQQVAAPAFLKSAATCTSKAVYYVSCVCGAHGEATFESGTALGHDYTNFQVVSEPTCTEPGQVVADCTRCDQKYDGAIAALGHDFTGECVPYVEDISYGDDDEGGTSYDGSEYHVHQCTRCDAVDAAHKEEHAFGEAVYSLSLVQGTTNMYNVNATYTCSVCGYKKYDTDEFNRYIGQDETSWTKGEEVKADYNQPGYVEYTFNSTGKTIRIATPQLVAPYVGTSYYSIIVRTGENGGAVLPYAPADTNITFDANGNGTGTTYPVRGENTVRIVDAETGALTYTRVDGNSTSNETGYIDLENGVIVRTSQGSYDNLVLMIPTSMTVATSDVTGSTWTDSMALAYNAKCNLNETHTFNAFVYDGNVYFGAKYVDMDGKEVVAGACSEASYVKVLDVEGNKVQAFAQKNGGLRVTDGKEGTYTSADNTLKLDGVGGFVLNGKSGIYTVAAEGASYGYDAYVGADVATATEYYQITLGENNSCTVVKPEATLRFRGDGVEGIESITANLNVVVTLPTPTREGYVFNGWKLNDEGEAVTTFVATVEGEDYAFEAQWSRQTTVTVKDLKDEDKAQYGTVYVGVGNPYVTALPAYDENTYRDGYKFAGWYLDVNKDNVIDDEHDLPLGDTDTAATEGADYVIFAVWSWVGNVEFVEQSKYAWEYVAETNSWRSTNWHVTCSSGSRTNSVMEIKWTSGVAVVEFDYWVTGEQGYDFLTIYYYDATGARKTIETKGSDIVQSEAKHVVAILSAEGQSVYLSYSKDSSGNGGSDEEDRAFAVNLTINGVAVVAQSPLNKNAGTYTSEGAEDIKVSAGGTVTINGNTYLTSNVSENVIGVTVDGVYKEYTLNTAAKTYTVVEPKVTVAYNYNGHGDNTSAQVGKYSNQTLSTEVPTADGFVFRGWYTDEALTKKASATFVASADITFYAKWDAAITLTYNYLNDDANADVVVNLYANDVVKTIQAVDFDWEGKKFAGWFTKDGSVDGDWGSEFKANTALTESTTVYAKWVAPHLMMGSYKGYNVYGNVTASSSTLTVDMFGTGISDYNAETGYFNFSGKYAYYDATLKMIVRGGKYADKSFGTDVYYYFLADSVSVTKSDIVSWNDNKSRLIPFVIGGAENATIVFINDKEVYAGAEWTAVDEKGAGVSGLANVASKAKYLTVSCGEKVYEYGKKSGSFVALDGYKGTYTSGDYNVTLDGLGNITGVLEGTYTKAADAGYTFDVKTTNNQSYKLTVNKEDNTCTYTTNTVKFTYVNDKKAIEEEHPYVGIQYTLPSGDAVKVDGYIFRGWYTDAQFSGNAVAKVTPSVDATYYAKYDAAVTLTFDYSGYEYESGKSTLAVSGKYVNDTLGNVIPTVASDVRYNGKVFAGWFFKEGENWGEQVTSSTKLTENVTIYARWIDPAAATGTYKGFEIYTGWSKTKTKSDFDTALTINADGKFTGKVSGTLSVEDRQKVNGAVSFGRYGFVNVAENIVLFAFNSSDKDTWAKDLYIVFKDYDGISKVAFSATNTNDKLVAWVTITYANGTTKNHFIYNDAMNANVIWKSGTSEVSATDCSATDTLVMYDSTGKAFLKKSGSTYLTGDGKEGSYNNVDVFGEIILDGYGTVTVGGQSVAYTLNEDKTQATFALNNQMRVIALGNGTYTLALDGYQGTYTLPDESTLALDGYGVVTGTNKTYVVSGTAITIYDGENSSLYVIDGKTLLGKSKFAGLTFTKDSVNYITFDDGVGISGKMICGNSVWSVTFTGEYNADTKVLTLTVVSEVGTGAKTGQKITFTVSDGKLVLNEEKPFQYVDVTKGYTYTNASFTA